jgi:PqqD family protein of HPr-rel-A system
MWRVVPGQALLHRAWDDEVVLFNNLSGDTHLLDKSAFELLETLQLGSATAPALAAALRTRCGLEDEPALEQIVADMLEQLAALSLVEAVS